MFEIERKFLIDPSCVPEVEVIATKVIRQGYLFSENKSVCRIRQSDDEYILTIKLPAPMNIGCIEIEKPLSKEEFEAMWSHAKHTVEKHRHEFMLNGKKAEWDKFHGKLSGFHLLEIEFDDENQAMAFVAPEWVGKEVTNQKAYSNVALGEYGIPN